MTFIKDVFVGLMGLLSLVYILNPGAGFIGQSAAVSVERC